jgi:hypothetical protein
MPRWAWPVAILIVLLGAAAGYATAPRYHAPQAADETRLKQRAVEYYRAARRLDMRGMAQLYTPAHQLQQQGGLAELVAQNIVERSKMQPQRLAEQDIAAGAIDAGKIEVEANGDWAVTSGRYTIPAVGKDPAMPAPLEPVVWVRTDGDWWVYLLEADELACYGNPPDFARKHVAGRSKPLNPNIQQQMQQK